jgi:peptidoglycan/xylan/chitin deacetylase (PgdA/CDA1 family)
MFDQIGNPTRRDFLAGAAGTAAGLLGSQRAVAQNAAPADEAAKPQAKKALIAITLDMEMARNFPKWEDHEWDYEKGNLNDAAKAYVVEVCRRVKARGGIVHTFAVGRVLEQANVDWLKGIAADGHKIGNHTYDHVNVLATQPKAVQLRFGRAPWLIAGKSASQVIRENIVMTSRALQQRVGVKDEGFRTPGGFPEGLAGREDVQQMLLDLGFKWCSAKYPKFEGMRDLHGTNESPSEEVYRNIVAAQVRAQPFAYPSGLIDIPMSPISDLGAFRVGRWQLPHFLKAIKLAINWVIENGAVYDFLAHPSCLGVVDPKFETVDLICDLVAQAKDRAAIVDLNTIAARATA